MKIVWIFLLLSLGGLNAWQMYHNYTWGSPGPYDYLLYQGIHRQASSFFRVNSEDVVFPARNTSNVLKISCIRAIDQVGRGRGGYASLYRGGVNYNHTVIHLKSQRGEPYNFAIEIIGRY